MAAGPSRGSLGSLTVAIGANTQGLTQVIGELRKVATSVRSLSTRVSSNTKKIEESFGKAAKTTKKFSSETDKATKSIRKQEAALIKEAKAIQAAENKTLNLVSAIRRAGGSREDIRKLTSSTRKFRDEIRAAKGDTSKFSNAQLRLAKTTNIAKRRLTTFNSTLRKKNIAKAAVDTEKFRNKMQDLSKSVSLALGPLSGVASRITAFSGLANRNTVAIAGMIAGIIGLGFVIKKAVQAGAIFEVQFRRIEAQLGLTGRAAEFSAKEVNKIAEEVADATLTNAKTARQAASALLFFGRVSKSQFKTVLNLAQSLSAVIGGDLVQSAKRIGRALQDPNEGLKSLNRQLTLLTPREEQVAKGLALMGKEAEATAFIIEKLSGKLRGLGIKEAAGIAGSFDTLIERIGRFLEIAGEAGGILQPFTDSLGRISEKLQGVNKELRKSPERLSVIGKIIESLAKAFEVVAFNLDIVAVTLGAVAFGKVVKIFRAMRIAIIGATVAMAAFNIVTGVLLNPIILMAAAVAGLAIKMKFFNDQVDRTTKTGLAKEIKKINEELVEQEKKLKTRNDLAKKMRVDLDAAFQSRGASPLEATIDNLRKRLKEATEELNKLTAASSMPSGQAFGPNLPGKEDERQLGDIALKLIEFNNQLALLDPGVSKSEKAMVELAKSLGLVVVQTNKGVVSFEFMKSELKEVGEGIQAAGGLFETQLRKITRAEELAAERTELLGRAIGRIQKPDIFISYQDEINRLALAADNGEISFKKYTEAVEAVDAALVAAQVAQQQLIIGITEQQTLQRFAQIKDVIGGTRDEYGRLNSAVTEYQEKLRIMNTFLAEGDIDQTTFNKALIEMDIQMSKNTNGAEMFASTVASGFSQGILAGEKLEDILARIGDRLIEAALQAAIFRNIMANLGGGSVVFGAPLPFDDPSAGSPGVTSGGGRPDTLVGTTTPA